MRRNSLSQNSLPEVNLVPMIDVMMSVLTFFIIITMSLAAEKSVPLRLPADRYPTTTEAPPLVIKLSAQGIALDQPIAGSSHQFPLNQPSHQFLSQSQLIAQVNIYWQQYPQGFVLLKPQGDLPYQKMMDVLLPLQKLGGDRVSLVIENEAKN